MCCFDENVREDAKTISDEIYDNAVDFSKNECTQELRIIWYLRRHLEVQISKRLTLEAEM